ncbi:class I SAM-dependent methyltransferase [Rhizobacter sp. OV335]|jgi:SAM-dependent methyltransferase|uniref:class I SAM-dependent methyltransferase n=1 Tax=Rhizobacter sp. OV335 TaxID=1500264 RepID=UPI00090F4E52|nr:class I SAM-dependent methyltransferase [Rhizobacter sp. OV335]SHL95708.1 Methyltransferase domain-containing protein [Rhizobacter sp. OV335]
MKCRHCQAAVTLQFIDLETSPPSNSYVTAAALRGPEKWYPLRVYTCTNCWLVQTEDYAHFSEMFSSDYAYFSSFSTSWLKHADEYVSAMAQRFELGAQSHVIEVASNDGYLLQYVKQRGIPCLGVEPTASTAAAAREKGIEVLEEFFGVALADRLVAQSRSADLTAANNVLAHVPDINDFVAGFARVLKADGVSTFEFPHLMRLVEQCQFDTIYHEHFSYLSLTAVDTIFARNGLQVFDVQELPTHGGSLRVFAQRADTGRRERTAALAALLERESGAGVASAGYYAGFQERANTIKDELMSFLIQAKRDGKRVGAYGAAAKGNTLLNYAGVRSNLLPWVVDRNPAKQDKYLPGCRIPIVDEAHLKQTRPDYVVILPWNLRTEVTAQLSYIRDWGGKFVTAVPHLEIS